MQEEAEYSVGHPSDKYAKRQRHPTRPDKYVYHGEQKPSGRAQKRKRTKRCVVGNEAFEANNIYAERVTLKSKPAQFIYGRSKVSEPLAGYDIPDLTFTKMNFLSRPQANKITDAAGHFTQQQAKRSENTPKRKRRCRRSHRSPLVEHSETHVGGTSVEQSSRCSEEPPDDQTLDHTAKWILDTAGKIESREHPTSSESRPRSQSIIEEKSITSTRTQSTTPVPWSVSPPENRGTRYVPKSSRVVAASFTHVQKRRASQVQDPSSTNEDDNIAAETFSAKLTESMLQSGRSSKSVHVGQNGWKRYVSLEDLNNMVDKSSKDPVVASSHLQVRDFVEVNKSMATSEPRSMDGTSFPVHYHRHAPGYHDTDYRTRKHQCRSLTAWPMKKELLAHHTSSECLDLETLPRVASLHYLRHKSFPLESQNKSTLYMQEYEHINDEFACSNHVSVSHRPADEYTRTGTQVPAHNENIFHQSSLNEAEDEARLDNFDLELLETTNARDQYHQSPEVRITARQFRDQVVSQNGSRQEPHWMLSTPYPSFEVESHAYRSLTDQQKDLPLNANTFQLNRPSLQRAATDDEFNPFTNRAQCML